jgi:hypothetical protein
MTVLDTNVVAVVLPTIARDLGASFADVEWVVSTYLFRRNSSALAAEVAQPAARRLQAEPGVQISRTGLPR